MDNVREFRLQLERFSEVTVPEKVRDLRDAITLEGLRGLVLLTPVDEGRLRGNYQTTIGAPAEGYDPDRLDPSGAETIAAGESVLSAARSGGGDPFAMTWIHNGVPYGPAVNDGTPPHVIEPVNAKALHWKTPDGEDVFARRVNHPGTPAVHMVEQTVERLRRSFG